MTMSEMVCCVEHHDECEMAGLAESCCAPDLHSDIGVLAPERSDTAYVADAASHVVVLPDTSGCGSLAARPDTLRREILPVYGSIPS